MSDISAREGAVGTPEGAHLTVESFGGIDQWAGGGNNGLSCATKIHLTQSQRRQLEGKDNPHSLTFLSFLTPKHFAVYFSHNAFLLLQNLSWIIMLDE